MRLKIVSDVLAEIHDAVLLINSQKYWQDHLPGMRNSVLISQSSHLQFCVTISIYNAVETNTTVLTV